MLYQRHTEGLALTSHVVRPDGSLNLADMTFMEQHHAETALSDTAADGKRQTIVEQLLVEIELFALLLVFEFQLTEQALLINTDTHR